MLSLKSIVLIAATLTLGAEASGIVPGVAAPLVAPAHVGYARAVPQNVAPYASQVSVVTKALSPYVAGPALAAPLAAPVVGHFGAPIAARGAAPYVTVPGPVSASPYAAAAAYSAAGYPPVPYAAAPYAPVPYTADPYSTVPYTTAPYDAAPFAAAPYAFPGQIAGPAAYTGPYPYAASVPLVRAPLGVAPAFVR